MSIRIPGRSLLVVFLLAAICGVFLPRAQAADVTLEQCVELALKQNHALQAQRLELSSRRELAKGVVGLAGPKVEFAGGYQWQSEPTGLIPAHGLTVPAVFDTRMGQYSLNLRQVVYDAGKTGAIIRYQRHSFEQQEQDVQSGSIQIVGGVTKAFYRTLQLRETVAAQRDAVAALRKLYDDSLIKFNIGRVAEVDLLQVESQLAAEDEKLLRYQSDLDRQVISLKALMGADLNMPLDLTGNLADYQAPKITVRDVGRNPEVQKAVKRKEQAQDLLASARADSAVQISLGGQYNLKRLPASQDEMWTVGLQANLPVFDGGVIAAGIRQAKFQLAKADEGYKNVLNDTAALAVSLENNFPAATARVGAAGKARSRAEESYRIMELSYRVGRASVTELLVTQSAMTSAQAAYYQAVFDQIVLQIELAAAYGEMPYANTAK